MEQKSGLIGIYEKEKSEYSLGRSLPLGCRKRTVRPDYERVMPWLQNALERMPVFAELGIKRDVHGAISTRLTATL